MSRFTAIATLVISSVLAPRALAAQDAMLVTEPETLRALETRGASLATQLGGGGARHDNAALAKLPRYLRALELLAQDIAEERAAAQRMGPAVTPYVFFLPLDWLTSQHARFELVGVTNRIDRTLVSPETCGEIRLLYRLAMDEAAGSTRLPMTAAVLHDMGRGDCAALAKAAAIPANLRGSALVRWLLRDGSPYREPLLGVAPYRAFEVNAQVSRWPALGGSNFAEQAHYLLRAFGPTGAPLPLENSPDVMRLLGDKPLRAELLAYLKGNGDRIARGDLVLPLKFLAQKAVSITPYGFGRNSNRAFTSLFDESDLPEGQLRRLDGFTCVGCHQSRGVAGFHFLGEEQAVKGFNELRVAFSAHVTEILPWRREASGAIAAGKQISPLPSPDAAAYGPGAFGAHCDASRPCAQGLACFHDFPKSAINEAGQCFTKELAANGDPCDWSQLVSSREPTEDILIPQHHNPGGPGYSCATGPNGFPGGMSARACALAPLGKDDVCVHTPLLGPFSACLNRGEPFRTCLQNHSTDVALRRCSATVACRDDYVCINTGQDAGACVPTYFIPQLTIDNHKGPASPQRAP